ncbi:esterase/lipase family protein [Streptomyces nigra]|uniref:esterase/lipase family protein n=1 Tax=Streptomyces nigra TaxID=1827580 RepID=UPI0037D3AA97
MRVRVNFPFLPQYRRIIPGWPTSLAPLKALAMEIALLAGHLILYPVGFTQERGKQTDSLDLLAGSASAPGPRLLSRAAAQAERTRLPVVLLHGFIDNRSGFVLLRRNLTRHGRRQIQSLNYSPLTCDVRIAAEDLARRIEEVCEQTRSEQVDVVGHSLGGLIARYYVQRLGGDTRVRTLVTLGTPHAGTKVAPLANVHPIVRQMRPGSPVLEELQWPAPGCRTHFYAFWSDLDHVMDPLEAARIEHPDLSVRNVLVRGLGHLTMLVHPTVAAGIRLALDATHSEPTTGPDALTAR